MFVAVKIAALSAVLAAAAVTLLDHHAPAPSASKFLTARIELAPTPIGVAHPGSTAIDPANQSCAGGWPYSNTCTIGQAATARRVVRVISLDRLTVDNSGRDWAHSPLAQR